MSSIPPADPESPDWAQAPRCRKRRRALVAIVTGLVIALGGGATAIAVISSQRGIGAESDATDSSNDSQQSSAPEPTAAPTPTPTPTPEPTAEAGSGANTETPAAPEVLGAQGIDDPASFTVVVNKQRPLFPVQWAPADLAYPEIPSTNSQPLRLEAAIALERMYAEANAAGVPFALVSGFRSYELQTTLFNNYVAGYGVESAETFSARPGFSEHQTGLVADISECSSCALSEEFGSTPQGQWTRTNAYRFGFILRYDQGMQPIVGYMYEPWHFRYVGVDVASDMHDRGITTLEEYFGLPAAPTY